MCLKSHYRRILSCNGVWGLIRVNTRRKWYITYLCMLVHFEKLMCDVCSSSLALPSAVLCCSQKGSGGLQGGWPVCQSGRNVLCTQWRVYTHRSVLCAGGHGIHSCRNLNVYCNLFYIPPCWRVFTLQRGGNRNQLHKLATRFTDGEYRVSLRLILMLSYSLRIFA
jgi:hypothetical protein